MVIIPGQVVAECFIQVRIVLPVHIYIEVFTSPAAFRHAAADEMLKKLQAVISNAL